MARPTDLPDLPAALVFPVGYTSTGWGNLTRRRPTRHAVTAEETGATQPWTNGRRPRLALCGREALPPAGHVTFDGRMAKDCVTCRRRFEAMVDALNLAPPVVAVTLAHQHARSPVRHACDDPGRGPDGRPLTPFLRAPCGQTVQPWWPAELVATRPTLTFDPGDERSCERCAARLRATGRIAPCPSTN